MSENPTSVDAIWNAFENRVLSMPEESLRELAADLGIDVEQASADGERLVRELSIAHQRNSFSNRIYKIASPALLERLKRPGLVVLVGRNGSGKSELLAEISGSAERVIPVARELLVMIPASQDAFLCGEGLDDRLHPLAQQQLVQHVVSGAIAHKITVVCTTYSPYLVDACNWEDIFVVHNRHVRGLTDHPEYEEWRDSLLPGEFWSSVGEEWVSPETE